VRVSGREYNGLIESPCYRNATHADRTLTCFSCHTLHKTDEDARTAEQWRVGQVSTAAVSNEACLKCHEPLRATVTAHTHHKADSPGSSCFNCHMPYTSYGLLKTIRSHTIGSPTVKESVETGRPNACNLCHLDRTLDWTGKVLAQWYKTPEVPLGEDEQQVAGSLLWLLKGDAGQRAIIAQAMAWPPAQQASGTDWMAPHLTQLLDDPYDAVRFSAARTMRGMPGFGGFTFDFVSPPQVRRQAQLRSMSTWDRNRPKPGRAAAELLQTPTGEVDIPRILALLKQSNNKAMLLRE